jgi:hypothetical protein
LLFSGIPKQENSEPFRLPLFGVPVDLAMRLPGLPALVVGPQQRQNFV